MKHVKIIIQTVVLVLIFTSKQNIYASLITFDNTTANTPNPFLRATKTYVEDDFEFSFEGKDINYLDSNFDLFTGLSSFMGDVLQFTCCRFAKVTITHIDDLPFNLNSLYGGTTKTSLNDQGDLFFRANYADGRVEDSSIFIENGRTLHKFSELQNLTSLILSRNLHSVNVKSSFPVIDDLSLTVFSSPALLLPSILVPKTSDLNSEPNAFVFTAFMLLMVVMHFRYQKRKNLD